jgi:hypothetical protein
VYRLFTAKFLILSYRSGQFRRQKSLGPLKKPREMADYVFFPTKKHKIPNF